MNKTFIKRLVIYILGYALMALGIVIHFKHHLGASPLDALISNLSKAIKIDVGLVTLIINLSFALLYFIIFKNKDIYLTVIGVFVLSPLISLFNHLLTSDITTPLSKIFHFILAMNIVDFGIALIYSTDLSNSAWECLAIVTNKYVLKNVEIGLSRAILETSTALVALLIGIIFLNDVGDLYIATIPLMLFTGFLVNFYHKILKKIIKF